MKLIQHYCTLREEFLTLSQKFLDNFELETLKKDYAGSINSVRKTSRIKDLRTFIETLEKRDVLNCFNIEPFRYISKNFTDISEFQKKLSHHETLVQEIKKPLFYNVYQNEFEQESKVSASGITYAAKFKLPKEHAAGVTSNSGQPIGEAALKETLLLHISERLGRSWRDVVRHLGIRECEIDALQSKYPFDVKEQSFQALRLYLQQCTTTDWKLKLICALEKGRRCDLKELAEVLALQKTSG